MHTAAIVVAAGRGERAPGNTPKQYRNLGGLPVLTRTIQPFYESPRVDAIVAIINPEDHARYEQATATFGDKLLVPSSGGATRQESVLMGLESLEKHEPFHVLVHDAARPLVSGDLIGRVSDALTTHQAAIPALAVNDTLKRVKDRRITEAVDRTNLWGVQTPQGFHYSQILRAHREAKHAGRVEFTDDSSIAEWHGMDVVLVEGSRDNMKLTANEDFEHAEKQLHWDKPSSQGEFRTGSGFDVHAFELGDSVRLCGIDIPHDKSLAGHSDADVGLHALTDALLGAIGDGDIGTHFPPTDQKWRWEDSEVFLKDAATRVEQKGARIVNVDLTLICEQPKIGPHRERMRENIARILGIELDRVGVKATTTEGLGFTGRNEGIAAQATAMICIL